MILDKFKLDGKTALVTGGNKGIGIAYATALAEAGADIVSVSYEEDFSEIEKIVKGLGRKFYGYVSDFSNRDSLYSFINAVKKDVDKIDILINNAGTIMRNPILEHSDDYWDRVIEVNLNAQFILTREMGRGMVERGYGKVVFIASLLSFQGGITVPGYAASKGGIKQLTQAFANEWAAKGITVNAILHRDILLRIILRPYVLMKKEINLFLKEFHKVVGVYRKILLEQRFFYHLLHRTT
jgi:2-deoxy-D-gluconate 3-dehydrogenase